jgi:hypothetical protein
MYITVKQTLVKFSNFFIYFGANDLFSIKWDTNPDHEAYAMPLWRAIIANFRPPYVCMYVWMNVCMYVCMYVSVPFRLNKLSQKNIFINGRYRYVRGLVRLYVAQKR